MSDLIFDCLWVRPEGKKTTWYRSDGLNLWDGWVTSLKFDPYFELLCIVPKEKA